MNEDTNQFKVTGEKTKSLFVPAESRRTAVENFKTQNPGYAATNVNGKPIIGWCVKCNLAIFEDDEYEKDEDGMMTLKNVSSTN